jgi:predicted transcriptional regulator
MCRDVWSEGSVMSGSTTMTIRVTSALKARLGRLAQDTRQSPSDLAALAVSGYVDRELAAVAGIRRGLDDLEAGRVIGHDDAVRALHAAIDKAGDKVGDKAGG